MTKDKKVNKGGDNMNTATTDDKVNERYCSPAESLEESLKQMDLIRKGKLPKVTWKDWFEKIKEDKESGRL